MCGNIAVTAGTFEDLCYTWHEFMNTFQYEISIVYNSAMAVLTRSSMLESFLCATATDTAIEYRSRLCEPHPTAGGDTASC